jgi:hypothetical protein
MNDFLSKVLQKIDGDPSHIGDVFGAKLTYQEELMLSRLDDEMGMCVERIIEVAMANANAANGGEIAIDFNNRERVMTLTCARKAIHDLLAERGTFHASRHGMN